MSATAPLLEARDVAYHYPGGIPGLVGATLAVGPGERLALLGANGCGKTTLLLALCGVLTPDRGEVRLRGRPVEYTRDGLRDLRRQVGTLLQDADDQLFAGTVYEDVSFGPLNLGCSEEETRRRVEQSLAAVGLTDLADRPPHRLSGGQKKRAALAGVAAMRPAVLLLDEPTANLDPHAAEGLLALLDRLHAAGAAVVVATHDVDFAFAWADRVAVLAGGRVAACGPSGDVFRDADQLRAAGLRQPWAVAVAAALGWPDAPRTPAALVQRIVESREPDSQ